MSDEPKRYTLNEARAVIAREECEAWGHRPEHWEGEQAGYSPAGVVQTWWCDCGLVRYTPTEYRA